MTPYGLASKPVLRCIRASSTQILPSISSQASRSIATTSPANAEAQTQASPKQAYYKNPDPLTVTSPRLERKLTRSGRPPIGSRRRRAALQTSQNIPFEELPYQCFQEARKILQADRAEKLQQIETERARILRLRATTSQNEAEEKAKQRRLQSMEAHLEDLKIKADINDPLVKRRFEDGLGDLNRPIYRFLADRKWREYRRPILMQRLTQMNVMPDVLPKIEPVVDAKLYFGRRTVQPGEFVEAAVSAKPGRLSIQPFTKGEKLVTIAIVDSDVPNVEKDGFDYRCHFLASNIPISPVSTDVALEKLSTESQVILPWFPAYAQKGAPYHRLSILIMEQKDGAKLDINAAKAKVQKDGFILRSFADRHSLTAIGAHLYRNKWDETTAAVMAEYGIEGADIEFRRKRVEPLPYKRRDTRRMRG